MKKIAIALAATVAAAACAISLAGCGSSSSAEETFTFSDIYEITVNSHEVVYDEEDQSDVLVVKCTVENTADEAYTFSSSNNTQCYQNGDDLSVCYNMSDLSAADTELSKGDSIEITYAWDLTDYCETTVTFMGYTSDVEHHDVVYDLTDAQTEECAQAQADAAEELAAKQNADSVDLGACVVNKVGDWYFDSSDDDSAELMIEGQSGYVDVNVKSGSLAKDAQEAAEKRSTNYNPDLEVSTTDINGKSYYYLTPTDTQFTLFINSSDGSLIEITGMFYSLDDARALVEAITIN